MKKKLSIVLAIILTLSLSLTSVTFAAGGQKEVDLVQEAGQAWLDSTVETTGEPLEWVGAHLTTPQVCYDLKGKPNAYMFAIENDNEVVGHIIVGSSDYDYDMLEASDVPPLSIPSADNVKSTLKRDLGLEVEKIGKPTRLLYLGFDNLYAVYNAGRQEIAVDLKFDGATPAANLTATMPSPEEYKANKQATREANPQLLESSDYNLLASGSSDYNWLPMEYYCVGSCSCAPSSGVSIGQYYREYVDRHKKYDYVTEGFEWGNDGDSLSTSGKWEVYAPGGYAVAEIDDDVAHSGNKSAHFSCRGGYPEARYPLLRPSYVGFYLMKDDAACCLISNDDGFNRIDVRINNAEQLEYKDYNGAYRYVDTLSANTWYWIEFRNIDWTATTYDIYVNGVRRVAGAQMYHYSFILDAGKICFKHCYTWDQTELWVDDIVTMGDIKADYHNLPDEYDMYDRLYDLMETDPDSGTSVYNYGPGFVAMAQERGYNNFRYYTRIFPELELYWDVVSYIDSGYPTAMGAIFYEEIDSDAPDEDFPPESKKAHSVAIKGYISPYMGYEHVVICTDSYSSADWLYLNWDYTGFGRCTTTIWDTDDVEDFEWGASGSSLANSKGWVKWTVVKSGNSKAVIDTAQKYEGSKSGKWYGDETNPVEAYFTCSPVQSYEFRYRRDSAGYTYFAHGDATHRIYLRISTGGTIYRPQGSSDYIWLYIGGSISDNTWYRLRIRNINWTAHTFDIYLDSTLIQSGVPMQPNGSSNGIISFRNSGKNIFWIDKICCEY